MPASTGTDVIQGAMRMLNLLPVGGTATTSQLAEGVEMLNLMIDEWRNEQLMCPWVVEESFALTSGDGEYSIGPGGDFNTTRPTKLEDSCFVQVGSVNYPITLINRAQYNSIPSTNVTGSFPQFLYYEPTFPLGTVKLWPLPGASNTLYLSSLRQLVSIPGVGTTISVPPGYDQCYRSNLALVWANNFGLPIPQTVALIARRTKRSIGRMNARIGVLSVDSALLSSTPNAGYIYGDIA